jgi:hypothetical protein
VVTVALVRRVEFEHRWRHPDALGAAAPVRSGRGLRWVIVALFLVGTAFVTQRLGLQLQSALCLFLGLLPFAWLAGSMVNGVFIFRSGRHDLTLEVGAPRVERLTMEVTEGGLRLTSTTRTQEAPWSTVKMGRDHEKLFVQLAPAVPQHLPETFTVPERAFASPADFDEFCLELQRAVWAAERR